MEGCGRDEGRVRGEGCPPASIRPSRFLINPAPGSHPIVAYAHSVFATCCVLNVSASDSARTSSAGTSDGSQGS